MKSTISMDAVICAVKEQVACDLAGEAAILDMKSGQYYGLRSVGARVWSLIQEPINFAKLLDSLVDEYDVDRSTCHKDLIVLLAALQEKGLIEICDPEAA